MTRDILSMNMDELRGLMADMNQPAYRAEQIFEWLHRRSAVHFDSLFAFMDNLPKALREALTEICHITPCRKAKKRTSKDGTVKYLFELNGLDYVESVLMKYNHGYSVCISTQVGCRMGCVFCASAHGGWVRNLTAGEMCAQVYRIQKDLGDTGRVSSVVLMGCGEPLDNFDAVIRFIELITHPKGITIGARHISLSTCGLVPQIRELAELRLQINLAVSLHGPNDEIRRQLLPVAKRYPIAELLDACRYYISLTNRRIMFEYALARMINDSPAHAEELANLLKGMLCHVNLIPINVVSPQRETNLSPTLRRDADAFAAVLARNGIPVTVRRSLGNDIAAACGQLRSEFA
jgi:23S rRNA (adenine2503-C2)-methyltransferase